ncbi:SGNH/GDSL hydrolase family protein [Lignipirellula cremea]|uniref:SGNH hydrolase-type esterase domain-containing protein n=1 Tax=Lignipirellula cremea TaxID=2528010 RepID=A0A518DLC6_9BACT|nr:hypothetical protein [Lignipirellula cremea]QDU92637.1 hypothetical protein Pla8534_03850 [Lignipirellula cremea]
MRVLKLVILLLLVLLLGSPARAAEPLPRVRVLGDNAHRNMARSAASELEGKVTLVIPRMPVGDSGFAISQPGGMLAGEKWDVIYFNFGFADSHYKDPNTKAIRAMSKLAGGVRVATPQQYEKNLRAIVQQLKSTGAKLIWASTTPIPHASYDNLHDPGSEIEFNAISARVMNEQKISINDMHACVLASMDLIENKSDRTPFDFKGLSLHPPIAECILREQQIK